MLRRVVLILVVIGLIAAGALWVLSAPRGLDSEMLAGLDGEPERGRDVFLAAGCGSCHMAPGREADPLVMSGGREFVSDFGTFYAPNISPDPEHGIGDWTQEQFITAVMRGVSPEGQHYYPAFPYTAYIRAEPQDIADLHAYMMTLPGDETASRNHDIGFPFNIRRAVGLWKTLFLQEEWVLTDDLTEEEARGRYLVEALSHCAECHTPRNMLGALDTARWMEGAPNPSGRGRIPPIAGEGFTWSAFDISAYLETGFTPEFDVVGGTMAAVVANLQQLEPAEREAIAAYLLRLRD